MISFLFCLFFYQNVIVDEMRSKEEKKALKKTINYKFKWTSLHEETSERGILNKIEK